MPRVTLNWPFRVAIALCLVPAVLLGQGAPTQPTFRSGVQDIEVDVLVTEDGNAVRGLTKDDFTILEDGIPQKIVNFSFIDLPIEAPAVRKAAATAVESDIATNTGEGRSYVMLLNGQGERARLIARRFIEEAVGPNDQMAVVQPLGNMSAAQGFTSNRHLMLAAIDRIDRAEESSFISGDPCLTSFAVVEEMAKRLGAMTGRRKVLLWFDPPSLFQANTPIQVACLFAQRDAARAATRNNVAFYAISTRGLTTELDMGSLLYKAGIRVLADDTGGDVIVDSNNFSGGFQRFVRDNSSYYLLGYTPAVEHRDGEFHEVTVRVNRPGVTVRSRRGYLAPDADAEAKPVAAVEAGLSAETADALRLPASAGALAIELFAAPFKGAAGNGSVLLGAQLRASDLLLGAGQRIEIVHQAMTTEGKMSRGPFHVLTLDFTPESRAVIERTGLGIIDRLELPRGRHQVRFVVHQPDGKTGMVVADVEIPDYTREPLILSGVVLASEQTAADRTLLSDAGLKAILGSNPTARRRFSRNDTITAFAEVYTNERVGPEGMRVTTTLTTDAGANAWRGNGRPVSASGGYTTRIPLAGLTPGSYVLTLEARAGRRTAARAVPFTVIEN